MRAIVTSLLVLALLAACSRKDVFIDGREVYSRTEKGRFKAVIPESFTSGPAVSIDHLVETARGELGRYTSAPSTWELETITRWHRFSPLMITITFTRGSGYDQRILIPLSADGRVLAEPSEAPVK